MTDINYLGTIPLGKITKWEDSKAATITPVSFPGQDSGKTEGVDTLGIISYINLSGKFVGTIEEIQGYIYDIKNIADGKQTSSRMLISPFVNSNKYSGSTKTRRMGSIGTNTDDATNKLIDTNANFQTWYIGTNDKVKNLTTGAVANVTSVDSETQLTLSSNIFPETTPFSSKSYAVTANINVKVISFNVRWELPGLTYCFYDLSVMQVI